MNKQNNKSNKRILNCKLSAFLLMCFLFTTVNISAQKKKEIVQLTITGSIVNEQDTPLEGVLVDYAESLSFTLTDKNGRFEIKVPENSILQFNLLGYEQNSVKITKGENIKVTLTTAIKRKERIVYLPYGIVQNESKITSAVSVINGTELENSATSFLGLALNGKLPGLTVTQSTGAPGADGSSLFVRGRNTWQSSSPTSFVDGHIRPHSSVDLFDIEQVSIHKDAAASSILGLRGGNGALMVTTRRGKVGRPTLRFKTQLSMEEPTKQIKFLDSWRYAKLYNEALVNDGGNEIYSPEDIELYKSGASPYTHPNVDWLDSFLKKRTYSQKYNMSVEGGSSVAKYYVGLAFIDNSGLYKTEKDANSYNTNASSQRFSIRSNVDISLTKDLSIDVSLHGRQLLQSNPGSGSSGDVFNTLYSIAPNKFPINYGKGLIAGTNEFRKNPYGILNYSGYTKYIHSTMEASMGAKQKLDFVTKGLSMRGSLAFDLRFDNTIKRTKQYLVYEYMGRNPVTSEPNFRTWGEMSKQSNNNEFGDRKIRIFDIDFALDYARTFGKHDVASTFMYRNNQESDDTYKLTNMHQGLHSRTTYMFDSRYIAEFSFAYQGTEQLPPSKRYGFFPAGSLAWVVSNESFIKENIGDILGHFKLRASYGITGSDQGLPYYLYVPSFKLVGSSRYYFGVTPTSAAGWEEDKFFLENVTWEESRKKNFGTDLRLFKDRLSLGFDYFTENTSQIINERKSISTILGMGANKGPMGNVGKVDNKGFEIHASYNGQFDQFEWTVGGSISRAKNKIVYRDDEDYTYSYQHRVGHSIGATFGLVSNGLYYDEQDLRNSPSTTFAADVFPGDIKYRDLNGDGKVDDNDVTMIGKSNLAEITYDFHLGAKYKGFDFNVLFSGLADRNYLISGLGIHAFSNVSGTGNVTDGNVQQYHWDNRYQPQDPSTWATAKYPRLSVAGRRHNTQNSDFWLENGSFLRLKSLELGYTLPQQLTKKFWVSEMRIFYSGYNLLTWDKTRLHDPEGSSDALNYPIQKISSLGVSIQF